MSVWQEFKMGDIAKLQQCFALNKKSDHYLSDKKNGIPLLKISDLFNQTETLFVKKNIPKQFIVNKNDIIYTRTAQVGYAFINKNGVIYNNCFKIIVNEKVDKKFLYFFLNIGSVRNYVNTLATGTAQQDLNHDAFKSIRIKLPPISLQKKIAKILTIYFDLIENNTKRIKLLKTSTRYSFDELFLRFKIKGKKLDINTKNNLPLDWKEVPLTDYIELEKGIEPGNSNYKKNKNNHNIPFLRVGDLNKRVSDIYVDKRLIKNKTINEHDVIISLDGTPGLVKFGLNGCYSSGIRKAKSKKKNISNIFIYELLNSQYIQKLIEAYSSGTTILHAGSSIKKMKFVLPGDSILDLYNLKEVPKFNLIINLLKKNKILQSALDIILPRLMTGIIDVKQIKIDI